MRAVIGKSSGRGVVRIPASKSMGHRLLLAAALAEGSTEIRALPRNEDIAATVDCLRELGCDLRLDGDTALVKGGIPYTGAPHVFPCRESGSTLRFLLPLALQRGGRCRFEGSERLFSRPLSVYQALLGRSGGFFESGKGYCVAEGKLSAGDHSIPGDISSQFVSGLFFALPFEPEDSRLELTGKTESLSYIRMTADVLRSFGILISEENDGTYRIPGRQKGKGNGCVTVPGDESGAAFFGALQVLGSDLELTGLEEASSLQGDRVWRPYLRLLSETCPTLSLADCPDLGPVLMAVAAAENGAVFTDTARLRLKESDRIEAMKEELAKVGVPLLEEGDTLRIPGGRLQPPSVPFSSHNDHRIAMSMGVLATRTGGTVENAECVKKSFPSFWELLEKTGFDIRLEKTT